MICTHCESSIPSMEARYAFDEPYCETCFYELFTYCEECDTLINRSDAYYNNHGDSLCADCYDDSTDEDFPENPSVDDADRNIIINLSRAWIFGVKPGRLISINQNDAYLSDIRERIGTIDNPLYLYGLVDRDEYQIKASADILPDIKEIITINDWDYNAVEDSGERRMGISYSLRQDHQSTIVQLIKELTSCAAS